MGGGGAGKGDGLVDAMHQLNEKIMSENMELRLMNDKLNKQVFLSFCYFVFFFCVFFFFVFFFLFFFFFFVFFFFFFFSFLFINLFFFFFQLILIDKFEALNKYDKLFQENGGSPLDYFIIILVLFFSSSLPLSSLSLLDLREANKALYEKNLNLQHKNLGMEEELKTSMREEMKRGETIVELNNLIACLRGEIEAMKKKDGLLCYILYFVLFYFVLYWCYVVFTLLPPLQSVIQENKRECIRPDPKN